MTEREALLRAVCENPDDDTPRLVFADWLQENDEEDRAEFIRVQIELLQHSKYTIPWSRRSSRAQKLLSARGPEWRAEVPCNWSFEWGEFSRGFLESLSIRDGKIFEQEADRLFYTTPIRRLFFGGVRLSQLTGIRYLGRLAELIGYATDIAPFEVREFLDALGADQLQRVTLINGVGDPEAQSLLEKQFGSRIKFPIT